MKKYLIFDLDWTLISSKSYLKRIITEYFEKNYPDFLDTLKYKLDYDMIWDFDDLLNAIFQWDMTDEKIKEIKKELYSIINEKVDHVGFISWTTETLNKLKQDFKIFLSTWNSSDFAKQILKKWWCIDCFDIIIWSEIIPKSIEHVKLMIDHTNDENFYENAVFIWDWPRDREIANTLWIKYIKIWWEDWYKSISEIDYYNI